MINDIDLLIDKKISNIGTNFLNSKKFDIQYELDLNKFLMLKRFKNILGNLNSSCEYNYSNESILQIIRTNIH